MRVQFSTNSVFVLAGHISGHFQIKLTKLLPIDPILRDDKDVRLGGVARHTYTRAHTWNSEKSPEGTPLQAMIGWLDVEADQT